MRIYAVIDEIWAGKTWSEENITAFANANGISLSHLIIVRVEGDAEVSDPGDAVRKLETLCSDADMVLFPGSDAGRQMAVTLGARTEGTFMTDVLEADSEAGTASKKVFAGNLIADYKLSDKPWCISADRGFGSPSELEGRRDAEVEVDRDSNNNSKFNDRIVTEEPSAEGLKNAKFIVAAGQGLGRAAAVQKVLAAADAAGARAGASRPVVMNGWAPMNSLIGVSGAITSADVCITAGASGAPAFFAGIDKSNTIIAINSDEHAPVMARSDLAVTGDAEEIMTALGKLIEGELDE